MLLKSNTLFYLDPSKSQQTSSETDSVCPELQHSSVCLFLDIRHLSNDVEIKLFLKPYLLNSIRDENNASCLVCCPRLGW